MKRWLSFFTSVPDTQRVHLLFLLVVIAVLSFWIGKGADSFYEPQQSSSSAVTDSFIRLLADSPKQGDNIAPKSLHFFNPNTLSYEGFLQLGVKEKLARTIVRYREKGGRFYRAEDLKKIYTMTPAMYERLRPYVRIGEEGKQATDKRYVRRPQIDINTASVEAIDSLPYMPTFIAERVIKYRNLLGGFYSVKQLREVYGLDSFKWEKIKDYVKVAPHYECAKISVNEADFYALKRHPYIRYEGAKEILGYRRKVGDISDTNVLKTLSAFHDMPMSKIFPYLQF